MSNGTVIVTAGYQGIGLAIARRFSQGGFRVYACDIAAPEAPVPPSEGLSFVRLDASDPIAVASFVSGVQAQGEAIDVLVNNVGIAGPTSAVEDITIEQWRAVVETNLNSAFYFVRSVVAAMKQRRSGSIINIVTSSVKTGMTRRAPYVSSKGGLLAFSHNLARELGPYGIRSNAISPGAVENERGRLILQRTAAARAITVAEAEAELLSHISMRSMVLPEEVADMAFFLASHAARHITGQNIGVCGNVEWEA